MRIFLSGGSGMVGRNFATHPLTASHELIAPSRRELNLLNQEHVRDAISDSQPDIIVHAAGTVGGIQANIRDPFRFLADNLDMGRNIIGAARAAGITRLINLGSSCMYPRAAPNPLKEEQILQSELEPTNEGYALAKIAAAKLCEYASRENPQLQYKTLIPCNLYGRFDTFDPAHSHMVPAIIHKLHAAQASGSKTVEIWGDGTARREFMFAADLADCLHFALNNFDTMPDLLNIGLGSDLSVNDYYRLAAEVVGYTGEFSHDTSKPAGMQQKLLDVSRANEWGWRSQTSIRDGITQTYAYYLEEQRS